MVLSSRNDWPLLVVVSFYVAAAAKAVAATVEEIAEAIATDGQITMIIIVVTATVGYQNTNIFNYNYSLMIAKAVYAYRNTSKELTVNLFGVLRQIFLFYP